MHCSTWLNFNSVLGFIINQGPFFKMCAPWNDRSHPLHLPNESPLCLMVSAHESVFLMKVWLPLKCVRERNRSENHHACFWPWPQSHPTGFHHVWLYFPVLFVLGSWTRTFIQILLMVHTPPAPRPITHWVRSGIDQTEAFGLLSRSRANVHPCQVQDLGLISTDLQTELVIVMLPVR